MTVVVALTFDASDLQLGGEDGFYTVFPGAAPESATSTVTDGSGAGGGADPVPVPVPVFNMPGLHGQVNEDECANENANLLSIVDALEGYEVDGSIVSFGGTVWFDGDTPPASATVEAFDDALQDRRSFFMTDMEKPAADPKTEAFYPEAARTWPLVPQVSKVHSCDTQEPTYLSSPTTPTTPNPNSSLQSPPPPGLTARQPRPQDPPATADCAPVTATARPDPNPAATADAAPHLPVPTVMPPPRRRRGRRATLPAHTTRHSHPASPPTPAPCANTIARTRHHKRRETPDPHPQTQTIAHTQTQTNSLPPPQPRLAGG